MYCVTRDIKGTFASLSYSVRTRLATNKVVRFVFVGGKTRNVAIQLVLQQCCKKVARFLSPFLPYP